MPDLDTLSIGIVATDKKATTSIDKLIGKLGQLQTALDGINTHSFNAQLSSLNSFNGFSTKIKTMPNITKSFSTSLSKLGNSFKATDHTAKSFAATIGKIYANCFLLFRLFKGIGNSIDAASDLVEVQNVVDQTFRNEQPKMEAFAKNSIVDFGMSELTAKKIGSRFQAMGTAMGITNEQVQRANEFLGTKGLTGAYADLGTSMADVSLTLTKLSADMSSFYNVENYEEMAQDLTAILTGMTRPLRDYGLDLTNATLQEWAMKNGIDADVKAMSQAEKTMLRYQYLLSQTTSAQNDFSRTAGTWANQIRLMGELFNRLKVAIGRGFIGMLKPLVRAVNRALNTIIDIVEQVVNALGIIFGWEVDIGNVGLAEEWEDTAGYADDAAGAMGDAADSAKKLKDYTLGIDELNIFHPDDDSGSGGGGGGGASGGGGGANQIPVEWNNDGDGLTSRFLDLIQKIVRPFQEAWKNAGQYVTDAWRYMLDEIGKLVHDIGRDMLEVWNQDRTIEMLTQVYRIAGDIFVTIGNIAMRLREAWNYNQTGLHILENIRDSFAIIIDHVRNVTSQMRLWAYNLDFKPLLTSFEELTRALTQVADFIGGVFEDLMLDLVLPYIKHLIEVSIPDLNRALTSIVNNVDWDRLRENIDLIVKAAEGLLESITDGLVQTVENLGIAVGNFVNSEEFQTFCENIANFMERIDAEMVSTVLTGIGLAVLDIAEALVKFVNSEPFQNFLNSVLHYLENTTAEDIANKIERLATAIAAFEFAKFVGAGFLNFMKFLGLLKNIGGAGGLLAALGTLSTVVAITLLVTFTAKYAQPIADWLDQHIGQPIEQWRNNTFGEKSILEAPDTPKPFSRTQKDTEASLSNIHTALTNWDATVAQWRTKVFGSEPLLEAPQAAKPFSRTGKDTYAGLTNVYNSMVTWGESVAQWRDQNLGEGGILDAPENAKPFEHTNQSIVEKLQEATTNLTNWVENDVKPLFTLDYWIEITQGAADGLAQRWETIVEWWNNSAIGIWWEENVAPWFSLDQWLLVTQGMADGLAQKWEEIVAWWTSTGFYAWWENDVLPWFEVETWLGLAQSIYDGISQKWTEVVNWWNSEEGFAGWWNKVVEAFSVDSWSFDGIVTGITNKISEALSAAEELINTFVEWAAGVFGSLVPEDWQGLMSVPTDANGNVVQKPFGGYASGGFPEVGSMFIAGEAGAEFVGNIGGRTGVVNTDQMAESVAAGNAQVVNVLLQVVDAIMSKDVSVNIGDREIALAANRGQSAIGRTIITG